MVEIIRPQFPPIANNAGPTTTTIATNVLLHTLPTGRSAKIVKIMAYNPLGANVTLQFGTLDRTPAGAVFVAMLPIFVAITTLDNAWLEEEIPAQEWVNATIATAAGRTGDIYVLASATAVVVSLEVVEFGG